MPDEPQQRSRISTRRRAPALRRRRSAECGTRQPASRRRWRTAGGSSRACDSACPGNALRRPRPGCCRACRSTGRDAACPDWTMAGAFGCLTITLAAVQRNRWHRPSPARHSKGRGLWSPRKLASRRTMRNPSPGPRPFPGCPSTSRSRFGPSASECPPAARGSRRTVIAG